MEKVVVARGGGGGESAIKGYLGLSRLSAEWHFVQYSGPMGVYDQAWIDELAGLAFFLLMEVCI